MKIAAALTAFAAAATLAAAPAPAGPRAAEKGCAWKRLSSAQLGLEVPYQRCDFGYRVIDFVTLPGKPVLYQSMADTGKKQSLYPVITVYTKKEKEGPDEAIRRVAFGQLSRYKRKHCRVIAIAASWLGEGKAAFTISPDEQYAAEVAKDAGSDVPDPPCGDLGEDPDALTYFEFHPLENPRRFVFVSSGQDTPLFDDTALKFLP